MFKKILKWYKLISTISQVPPWFHIKLQQLLNVLCLCLWLENHDYSTLCAAAYIPQLWLLYEQQCINKQLEHDQIIKNKKEELLKQKRREFFINGINLEQLDQLKHISKMTDLSNNTDQSTILDKHDDDDDDDDELAADLLVLKQQCHDIVFAILKIHLLQSYFTQQQQQQHDDDDDDDKMMNLMNIFQFYLHQYTFDIYTLSQVFLRDLYIEHELYQEKVDVYNQPYIFPIKHILRPLLKIIDTNLYPSLKSIHAVVEKINLSSKYHILYQQIISYIQQANKVADHYHANIHDLYKVANKRDLPQCIITHPYQNTHLCIATSYGIREISINDTIKYRHYQIKKKKEEDFIRYELIDNEAENWYTCYHRYDAKKKLNFFANPNLSSIKPLPSQCFYSILFQQETLSALHSSANKYYLNPIYKHFTQNSYIELRQSSSQNKALIGKNAIILDMAVHPTLPIYISVSSTKEMYLWHFGWQNPLAQFSFDEDHTHTKQKIMNSSSSSSLSIKTTTTTTNKTINQQHLEIKKMKFLNLMMMILIIIKKIMR